MGLVYHFECENPNCSFERDVYIGVTPYADIPRNIVHVTSIDDYKEYLSNHKRCPECDSLLRENPDKAAMLSDFDNEFDDEIEDSFNIKPDASNKQT
ncbi:MAG: hypothetical protein K5656_00325 [Lachnospiraceae bacterium]|nr:hypothetical protein [Lachnospiraceae bacterium]